MELLEGRLRVADLDSFVAGLDEVGDRHGATIQAFDARYVADCAHLERAVELADRSIARGENVARDRAVEILLYAAGRRQIDRALEMGVSEGENEVVLLIDADDGTAERNESAGERDESAGERDESAGERDELAESETNAREALEATLDFQSEPTLDERNDAILCSFFEITDAERGATDAPLEALVRERVALLEVEK